MNGAEVCITIGINCLIIYLLHVLHKRSIAKTVRHLRKEVNELENLVAAIIEEFEEVADRVWQSESQSQKQIDKAKTAPPIPIENTTQQPFLTEPEPSEQNDESLETPSVIQTLQFSDPKHQRIFQLWQQGLAIEEIAKQLGTGRGEVQLILGIYKRS